MEPYILLNILERSVPGQLTEFAYVLINKSPCLFCVLASAKSGLNLQDQVNQAMQNCAVNVI